MNIKLLPFMHKSTLNIDEVSALSITPDSRALKPYPPGKVRVNDDFWPNSKTYYSDVTLTWAHRNRKAQAGAAVIAQDAASISWGPEGYYSIEVLIAGSVVRTSTGVTGTSFVYTLAQRTADDADLNKAVQFRITPVNGSYSGRSRTTDPFYMSS